MIDLHTHILTGFDDGARSLDESIEMARQAAEEGIHTVVASPHIYDMFTKPTLAKIMDKTEELNLILRERGIACRVLPGSEVHIAAELNDLLKRGEIMTVANNGRYLLLELPLREVPAFTEDVIYDLNLGGIRPIIAHPERNQAIMAKPALLERLIHIGALTQVSSGSLMGNFGSRVKHATDLLMEGGMLHIVASDGHSPRRRRIHMANARQHIADRYGEQLAESMCRLLPRMIVDGRNVPIPEVKPIQWYKHLFHHISFALPR